MRTRLNKHFFCLEGSAAFCRGFETRPDAYVFNLWHINFPCVKGPPYHASEKQPGNDDVKDSVDENTRNKFAFVLNIKLRTSSRVSQTIKKKSAHFQMRKMAPTGDQLEDVKQETGPTLPPDDSAATIHDSPVPTSNQPSLFLPPTVNGESSVIGVSTRSMRTSSFAMSDISDNRVSPLESLRIRKAYSVRSPHRVSDVIPESEIGDYPDEKDFQNTDR